MLNYTVIEVKKKKKLKRKVESAKNRFKDAKKMTREKLFESCLFSL